MGYGMPLSPMAIALLQEVAETPFQNETVIPMAMAGGWRVSHTSESTKQVRSRTGDLKIVGDSRVKGFPDLTLVHPDHGIIIVELKRESGWSWRPGQKDWLDLFAFVGAGIRDWGIAAAAIPGFPAAELGPCPQVYAALWRPGDLAMIEDVLIRHQFTEATWWPDHRR